MQGFLYYAAVALLLAGGLATAVYIGMRPSKVSMAPGQRHLLSAYGLDVHGDIVELGPVSRAGCRALVDERYALIGRVYETGEEAMADGMFGFRRSETDYIEVDLIDAEMMTIRAGVDAIDEDVEEQVQLTDITTVKALVDMYSDELTDFPAYWHRRGNRMDNRMRRR